MKDAFGGTFMIKVLIVFFVIYISFMTVAIGYAKAFRIKNHIVSILEKPAYSNVTEGYNNAISEIETYIGTVAYDYSGNIKIQDDCDNRGGRLDVAQGICIAEKGNSGLIYYEVTSYYVIEPPLFNVSILAPIRGETKIVNQ